MHATRGRGCGGLPISPIRNITRNYAVDWRRKHATGSTNRQLESHAGTIDLPHAWSGAKWLLGVDPLSGSIQA